jgi:predicted transcriptional regulator
MANQAVSAAELRVLQLLWDHGRLTARQITQHLYPGMSLSDIATTQKLVQRLEQKQLLGRDRSSHVHLIYPLIDRDEFATQQLTETATKLARGSLKTLLVNLLGSDELTTDDLAEIRQMLDKHRKRRR